MIDQKLISTGYFNSKPPIAHTHTLKPSGKKSIIIKASMKYFTAIVTTLFFTARLRQVRQMKGNGKHIWCLIALPVNRQELKENKRECGCL